MIALAADSEDELLEAVVQHGTTVHGYEDNAEFREMVSKFMKNGTPPV
jgi:predicted small metal-binding protein